MRTLIFNRVAFRQDERSFSGAARGRHEAVEGGQWRDRRATCDALGSSDRAINGVQEMLKEPRCNSAILAGHIFDYFISVTKRSEFSIFPLHMHSCWELANTGSSKLQASGKYLKCFFVFFRTVNSQRFALLLKKLIIPIGFLQAGCACFFFL